MTEDLFTELASLLDLIEMALVDGRNQAALDLVMQRFAIMSAHGLTTEITGLASGSIQ